ncbi:DNA replication/repair protein RecF [Sphingorhabdus sp. IMCC26285]|uniref:DNA replication and repair protein RecF n=1 Tax=Sphingorhabdus profundilacus TaxID=2509718 RepID=A0A6I4LXD1_9SPHN|nr:DNA replication/repair protein RecF [Sphingorhabdus profundilacus]MVZ96484.1 DNA replication/repair protein RecF [Sphingorhabdus profundilacus]
MTLSLLTLTNFRNHARLTVQPQAQFIALHGPNGAGKTNILEAVSLLVPGRGLRRAALSEMANSTHADGFTISAELDGIIIGTGIEAAAPERRKVRINGANASINALAEWLSAIWLTPSMDRLFVDGAGSRRRFLDRLVLALEPGHARHASRYEKAVQQRNRILATNSAPDAIWLDATEAQMAESGAFIIDARARMLAALDSRLAVLPKQPFPVPAIRLAMVGPTKAPDLKEIWRASRRKDAGAGRTLVGPHRADLEVYNLANGQSADRCSTGEQKALLLSLILAHAALVTDQRGAPPILLLDEVAAHLDPLRRAALFERLTATGAQVWMTGTEAVLFDAIGPAAHLFAVPPL